MEYGWSGLFKNQTKTNSDFIINLANSVKNLIIVARVTDIILDDSNPLFSQVGEWNGIGVIQYETIDKRSQVLYGLARPIDSNLKKYPLINELVYIITTYNTNIGDNPYSISGYYINSINLWNHPHHNGYPNDPNALPPSQEKDYQQTEAGSVRRVTDNSTEIFLGDTFKERANIHPLRPFEGDVIYEGRWGNSIRLGSTISSSKANNWSETGEGGDPITIIRNGQGSQSDSGWLPITEDINNDNSSIYLTSTQKIPLNASTNNYTSYSGSKEIPAKSKDYAGTQIILNSGRLVFNSNQDHILFSSAKSINLNSVTSVNIDTTEVAIQADKIYLGKNQATEPLMLGTQTNNLLKNLIETLIYFMDLSSEAKTNVIDSKTVANKTGVTIPVINQAASDTLNQLKDLKAKIDQKYLLSKRNYTL